MKKVFRFLLFGFVGAILAIVAKAIFSWAGRKKDEVPGQIRKDPYEHHSFFDEGANPKDR